MIVNAYPDRPVTATVGFGLVPPPAGAVLAPAAVAAALAALALALDWRGGDWPAQLLRLGIVERDGIGIWNNLWFAGHHTPGYGLGFPVLAAVVGAPPVVVASCAIAAAAFASLVCRTPTADGSSARVTSPTRRAAAVSVFAAGTVVNVAVGRLTFALGMAVALAALALLAGPHRHTVTGGVLVAATAVASPVAAVFLAIALTAWAVHARRPLMLAGAALAVVPVAVATWWFPQGGRFPFRFEALVWSLALSAAVAAVTTERVVRWGALIYAGACLAVFVVPNPLGANVSRLGMFVVAPIVVLTARPRLPVALAPVVVAAALWWQWSPAVDGIVRAGRDPSAAAAYHEPLVDALLAAGGPVVRVEVVPTQRHWETTFVAGEVLLARGWERQLDMGRNPLFYELALDAEDYRRWLADNAVQFVALADAPLDPTAQAEAELVVAGVVYLEPVWSDEHWRLWRVVDAVPLVEGAGRIVAVTSSSVVLDVDAAGPLLVRVRWSTHWSLDGPGCVRASPDGWTVVEAVEPGRTTLRAVVARSLPGVGALDACAN